MNNRSDETMGVAEVVKFQDELKATGQGEGHRDVQLTAPTDEGQEVRPKNGELAWKTTRPLNKSTPWTRTDCARQRPWTIEILQRDDDALFGDPNV